MKTSLMAPRGQAASPLLHRSDSRGASPSWGGWVCLSLGTGVTLHHLCCQARLPSANRDRTRAELLLQGRVVAPVPTGSRDSEHATLPWLHFPTRAQTPPSREACEDAARPVSSHRRREGRDLGALLPEMACDEARCWHASRSPRASPVLARLPAPRGPANCGRAGAELQTAVLPGDGTPDQPPDNPDPRQPPLKLSTQTPLSASSARLFSQAVLVLTQGAGGYVLFMVILSGK